jgi:hypothetical protein
MGIYPALNFVCNQPRPYSKMLTLPMVHPVPRKLSSHPCELHAIFFNVLKFRVESHHFQETPLSSDDEYRAALKKVEGLFDAIPNTAEGSELEKWISLVESYENEHFPM